jgi:hypothetical protein
MTRIDRLAIVVASSVVCHGLVWLHIVKANAAPTLDDHQWILIVVVLLSFLTPSLGRWAYFACAHPNCVYCAGG